MGDTEEIDILKVGIALGSVSCDDLVKIAESLDTSEAILEYLATNGEKICTCGECNISQTARTTLTIVHRKPH